MKAQACGFDFRARHRNRSIITGSNLRPDIERDVNVQKKSLSRVIALIAYCH